VRWRTLLLIGAGLYAGGLALGFVGWGLLAPDEPLVAGAVIISLLLGPVFLVLTGFLAGWFGREHDDVILVAIGFGLGATVGYNVAVLAVGEWDVVALVFGPIAGFIAAMVGRIAWWVGNAICELRGLPSASELVGPAYPKEVPSDAMWTTRAAPTLRATLDALTDRIAPGAPVDARAVGVMLGFPRDRPVVVALASDRLGIQQVDMEGAAIAEPIVIENFQLAAVSIRSEHADGSSRDHVNAFDDMIVIDRGSSPGDGGSLRLRLPYDKRGAGRGAAGPEAIRAWLRTNATLYR
jgi:hypothetical protein